MLIHRVILWALLLSISSPVAAAISVRNDSGERVVSIWVSKPGSDRWQGAYQVSKGQVRVLSGFGPGTYDFAIKRPRSNRTYYSRDVELSRPDKPYVIKAASAAPADARNYIPELYVAGYDDLDVDEPDAPDENMPATRRLGVNCHKCRSGIHLTAVNSDGPANRCQDENGQPIRLEAGDHIVEVNGTTPRSYEHYIELLQASPRTMHLIAVDHRSGKRLSLTTELW